MLSPIDPTRQAFEPWKAPRLPLRAYDDDSGRPWTPLRARVRACSNALHRVLGWHTYIRASLDAGRCDAAYAKRRRTPGPPHIIGVRDEVRGRGRLRMGNRGRVCARPRTGTVRRRFHVIYVSQ